MLFVIPWGGHWIIGTTDTDWRLDRAHPAASARDIEYLLDQVNTVLDRPLTTADIEGVYAGLRPLLSGEADSTSKLSREHAVVEPMLGLLLVAGGKYTTYRVMAADVVDRAARRLGGPVRPSRTDQLPLLGADGFAAAWRDRADLARRHGVTAGVVEHLLERYGTLDRRTCSRMIAADPALAAPLRRRAGVPGRRGGVRGAGRGRAAPRRRADPAHPDLDRDRPPRRRVGRARRRGDGRGARLGRGGAGPRGRALPGPGRRPSGSRSRCPTTSPPTPPGSAPRTSAAPSATSDDLAGVEQAGRVEGRLDRPVHA